MGGAVETWLSATSSGVSGIFGTMIAGGGAGSWVLNEANGTQGPVFGGGGFGGTWYPSGSFLTAGTNGQANTGGGGGGGSTGGNGGSGLIIVRYTKAQVD
jgi:hypothetical protein